MCVAMTRGPRPRANVCDPFGVGFVLVVAAPILALVSQVFAGPVDPAIDTCRGSEPVMTDVVPEVALLTIEASLGSRDLMTIVSVVAALLSRGGRGGGHEGAS